MKPNVPARYDQRVPHYTSYPTAPVYRYLVQEIELRAGGKAEWYLTGNEAGRFAIECGVPAHAQAGMVGEIIVD